MNQPLIYSWIVFQNVLNYRTRYDLVSWVTEHRQLVLSKRKSNSLMINESLVMYMFRLISRGIYFSEQLSRKMRSSHFSLLSFFKIHSVVPLRRALCFIFLF